jgi:uncharacterized Zn-binding protein involved in type VI secretion
MGNPDIVQVRPGDLYTYGGAVGQLWIQSAAASLLLADIGPRTYDAFLSPPSGSAAAQAGQFAGAGDVALQQATAQEAFRQFLNDVSQGLFCLGSAATVLANSYESTEASSAATIEDVQYAFGEGTSRPSGLPAAIDGETLQHGADGQALPEAVIAGEEDATSTAVWRAGPDGSTTVSTFADGSSREVTRSTAYNGGVVEVVGTTERAADGTVLRSRTVETLTVNGQQVRQVIREGDRTTTTALTGGRYRTTTQVGDEEPQEAPEPVALEPADAGSGSDPADMCWVLPIEQEEVAEGRIPGVPAAR